MSHLLQLTCSCLSFDFIGTSMDESSDDLGTVQIPTNWRGGMKWQILYKNYSNVHDERCKWCGQSRALSQQVNMYSELQVIVTCTLLQVIVLKIINLLIIIIIVTRKPNFFYLLSLFSIAFLNFATLQLFFDLYRALPTSLSPMVSILKLRAGYPQCKKLWYLTTTDGFNSFSIICFWKCRAFC